MCSQTRIIVVRWSSGVNFWILRPGASVAFWCYCLAGVRVGVRACWPIIHMCICRRKIGAIGGCGTCSIWLYSALSGGRRGWRWRFHISGARDKSKASNLRILSILHKYRLYLFEATDRLRFWLSGTAQYPETRTHWIGRVMYWIGIVASHGLKLTEHVRVSHLLAHSAAKNCLLRIAWQGWVIESFYAPGARLFKDHWSDIINYWHWHETSHQRAQLTESERAY